MCIIKLRFQPISMLSFLVKANLLSRFLIINICVYLYVYTYISVCMYELFWTLMFVMLRSTSLNFHLWYFNSKIKSTPLQSNSYNTPPTIQLINTPHIIQFIHSILTIHPLLCTPNNPHIKFFIATLTIHPYTKYPLVLTPLDLTPSSPPWHPLTLVSVTAPLNWPPSKASTPTTWIERTAKSTRFSDATTQPSTICGTTCPPVNETTLQSTTSPNPFVFTHVLR